MRRAKGRRGGAAVTVVATQIYLRERREGEQKPMDDDVRTCKRDAKDCV
jgi:hypothetical protein